MSFHSRSEYFFGKRSRRQRAGGFSLIELLVSLAILVIVLAIILVSQSGFSGTTVLNTLTYDVALTIRQAQTYGLSVRASEDATFPSYGVYFSAAIPNQFILFADTPVYSDGRGNGKYDYSNGNVLDSSEIIDVYTLRTGTMVSHLCAGSLTSCSTVSSLTLLFRRPHPDAIITGPTGGGREAGRVTISSSGRSRTIYISRTGQLSVVAPASTN